ncbi:hypothetical protein [Vulcanisaeta souniana]|uniref:hypothetical protein n=1 Tax=Vulcanisaeta souniana TaxID=164452 RepID=UPI001FB20087|nr:hypothetical protein [Vulcanisaeta souniana]
MRILKTINNLLLPITSPNHVSNKFEKTLPRTIRNRETQRRLVGNPALPGK